jgi:hypothetical protein
MAGDARRQSEHQRDRDDHPDRDLHARFFASRASPRRPDLTLDRMDRPAGRLVHQLFEARKETMDVNDTGTRRLVSQLTIIGWDTRIAFADIGFIVRHANIVTRAM